MSSHFIGRRIWIVLAITVGACDKSQSGPCNIIYEEAVLSVVRVEDALTKNAIPRVYLRSIRLNDVPLSDLHVLTVVGAPVKGVTVSGNELICDVSCSFGVQEGIYQLTVYAQAYRDTTITAQARYAQNASGPGGCPVRLSGGMKLQLKLSPT